MVTAVFLGELVNHLEQRIKSPICALYLRRLVLETVRDLRKISDVNNPLVFPGRSAQSKGKSLRAGMDVQEDREEDRDQAHADDFRDYFCNEVAASTRDPALLMRLMLHPLLETTTKSLRTVSERMDAVKNLGASSEGEFDSKQVQITVQKRPSRSSLG